MTGRCRPTVTTSFAGPSSWPVAGPHVRLEKVIPPGAGLGGGSADAAAVLRWAGEGDLERAATIGADVPFCLVGGRAVVRGIGEVVEPLPFVAGELTLLTPPFGCSTAEVYRAWDRLGAPHLEGEGAGNDLEAAALDVRPELATYRDALARATGKTPRLAGSGSTWFVEGAFPGEGRVVVRRLPATGEDWPSDGDRRGRYLPAARRWKRVRFSIFLCFFFRMRLRRFLINEPMARGTLAVSPGPAPTARDRRRSGAGTRTPKTRTKTSHVAYYITPDSVLDPSVRPR